MLPTLFRVLELFAQSAPHVVHDKATTLSWMIQVCLCLFEGLSVCFVCIVVYFVCLRLCLCLCVSSYRLCLCSVVRV